MSGMDFTDKRVLVTGGTRGIGFGVVSAFLDAGARIAINGKTSQSVNAALEKLGERPGAGEHLVAAPGDIGTVSGCETAVRTAVDAFDGLDIVVNSAGMSMLTSI